MNLRSNRVLKGRKPEKIEKPGKRHSCDKLSSGEKGATYDNVDGNAEIGMDDVINADDKGLVRMKLRSNRVLKGRKPEKAKKTNKRDSCDKLSSGGIGATFDNVDENVEMGVIDVVNTDDKGLFLGSEVLDPVKDLVVSCPKVEVEEENESVDVDCEIESVDVDCENGSENLDPVKDLVVPCLKVEVEEENESVHVDCEIESVHVECENGSENLDYGNGDIMVVDGGENIKETLVDDSENVNVMDKGRLGRRKKNVGNCKKNGSDQEDIDGEVKVAPLKLKRERKGKTVNVDDSSKKRKVEKDGIHVSVRVLRSRSRTTVSDGVLVVDGVSGVLAVDGVSDDVLAVDGGVREIVLGLRCVNENMRPKKEELKRIRRPRKVVCEAKDENPRPRKKFKRRGRPRKAESEITFSPLMKKDGSFIKKSTKKIERRGRPRVISEDVHVGPMRPRGRPKKLQGNETVSQRIKDMICKKLKKHHGRPIKVEAKTLATHVLKMRRVKLMEVKKGPEIQKIAKIKKGEVNGGHLARREQKQLIRDKISDMLLKSGWMIERKQRQEKTYQDAIYVEPDRKRSHWSTTRAYFMLKKKVEEGDADDNEISAYYPIPEEEISMLFRHVNKELGYKKKNRMQQKVKKGKVVTDKKKKLSKKTKNGSKSKFGKKITERRKPRLLARGSKKGFKQDKGDLINKKRNLLSFMIDLGVILVGSKVQYGKTRKQKKSSEGTITSDGICCSCCDEVMGISEFVSHFGGEIKQGVDNVYLESGTSLRKCLVDSWRKEEESNLTRFNNVVDVKGDDPNDNACNICGDGGNLICCDGCPSTFHQSCLGIQNFPSGDWNCIYCSCKFCGVVSVTTPQVEDSHETMTFEMVSCCLCEEKFHRSCLQEVEDEKTDSNRQSFCGRKCQEIFERLQTYLGVKHELEDGYSWTLLQRSDVDQDLTVHDNELKVEHNCKLAVAFSVMDECFLPVVDERSGTNIIHNVVYNCGSNFKRMNYTGFLTAVLEKNDELITVASIRIHGYRLAEMPFIGTRFMYRRQGMCRRLLDAIELCLSSIGVEELLIPAIPELLQTWTKVFSFMPIEESMKLAMKCMSMIVFPGIDMLKKPLLQNQSADTNTNPSAASDDKIVECTIKLNGETVSHLENVSSNESGGEETIDHEQTEEATVAIDGCNCPEEDAINNEQTEEPTVWKDDIDFKQTEEETVLMDCSSCPKIKDDKLISSQDANSLCDLNIPVTNGLSSNANGQTSVESESFPDSTIEPSSIVNDGILEVKVKLSPLTSELVPKNTFDLNLDPTGVETDMNITRDESVQCDIQVCIKSSEVDHSDAGQLDSKPCESQPLVIS